MSAAADRLWLEQLDRPGTLVLGIGNAGRRDDGLGWRFVDWMERERPGCRAELCRRYQLLLEDADLVAGFRRVLFVDAVDSDAVARYRLTPVRPRLDLSFTSHALSIPALLATCRTCFGRLPESHLLAIRGYRWSLGEGLSGRARANLRHACEALERGCPVGEEAVADA